MRMKVYVNNSPKYQLANILPALPDEVFEHVKPGDKLVIKPNWVMESHKYRPDEWEYVITHPMTISAVLHKILRKLSGSGRISIIDGPMTEASFDRLISHYPVDEWKQLANHNGVDLEIIDLRDHEWVMKNDVIIERKSLTGDPRGEVLFNLQSNISEFFCHRKSKRGYYGADYDRNETNRAHDGHNNRYSISRTVIESDVFINIPKLKTHRLAGITCCLKNLVGINTYKNYLPHYTEGEPGESGDQFPCGNITSKLEGSIVALLKQYILATPLLARHLTHLNTLGKKIFGDSDKIIRNGSWFGNDTIWRMILDLNKVLLYGNPDGTMRQDNINQAKRYIGIVDAVLAGEGEGPLSPDPFALGRLICGTNPVAIDAVCSTIMGFDYLKIPTIARAFEVRHFPICNFHSSDIDVCVDGINHFLSEMPANYIFPFKPQHGWKGNIEKGI